jgi:hypothetical protein
MFAVWAWASRSAFRFDSSCTWAAWVGLEAAGALLERESARCEVVFLNEASVSLSTSCIDSLCARRERTASSCLSASDPFARSVGTSSSLVCFLLWFLVHYGREPLALLLLGLFPCPGAQLEHDAHSTFLLTPCACAESERSFLALAP